MLAASFISKRCQSSERHMKYWSQLLDKTTSLYWNADSEREEKYDKGKQKEEGSKE